MRRLYMALLIAFIIQLPFLILMNFVGVHSALGGAWVIFYLPAILLLDIVGSPGPGTAPFFTTLEVGVIQELILLAMIFPLMVLYTRFRSSRRAERLAKSPANIESQDLTQH